MKQKLPHIDTVRWRQSLMKWMRVADMSNEKETHSGKKGFKTFLTRVAIIVVGALVLALFWYFLGKGIMIWSHVDKKTPVSKLIQFSSEVQTTAKENKKQISDLLLKVGRAVEELEKQRLELLLQHVRGQASRVIDKPREGENKIFVNTNSDARRFKIGEEVEIMRKGITIRARVKGTITNPNDLIIGQLNPDAAEALAISERMGIGTITIRRILPAKD